MIWPLRILAVFSVIGGVIGIEALFGRHVRSRMREHPHGLLAQLVYPFQHAPVAALQRTGGVRGWPVRRLEALRKRQDRSVARETRRACPARWRTAFTSTKFTKPRSSASHDFIAAVADWIDRWIVEGFCIGLVRGGTDLTGRALRLVQTGNLQTYAFLFVLGVAVVLWFVLGK